MPPGEQWGTHHSPSDPGIVPVSPGDERAVHDEQEGGKRSALSVQPDQAPQAVTVMV